MASDAKPPGREHVGLAIRRASCAQQTRPRMAAKKSETRLGQLPHQRKRPPANSLKPQLQSIQSLLSRRHLISIGGLSTGYKPHVLDEAHFDCENVLGAKQLTDVYLLGLAAEHKGRFVSFDRTIAKKAVFKVKKSTIHLIDA